MGQVMADALQGRDAAIWAEWVNGLRQAQIAERRGIAQQTVSDAIARYLATIPTPEKSAWRERMMERYEALYQAHAQTALERPRVAAIVRGILDSEARLLGLVQSQLHVEHDGMVQHQHEPGPTVAEILERWRAEGKLRVRGEITRLDQGHA
jgi:hypothetical protein